MYFVFHLVKDRFDNMRTTYQRNYNKIKQSLRSGKGSDDIFQPKWDLYPLLTFLKKNSVQASSSSNLDATNEVVNSHLTCDDTESSILLEEDRDVYFDETLQVSIISVYTYNNDIKY